MLRYLLLALGQILAKAIRGKSGEQLQNYKKKIDKINGVKNENGEDGCMFEFFGMLLSLLLCFWLIMIILLISGNYGKDLAFCITFVILIPVLFAGIFIGYRVYACSCLKKLMKDYPEEMLNFKINKNKDNEHNK